MLPSVKITRNSAYIFDKTYTPSRTIASPLFSAFNMWLVCVCVFSGARIKSPVTTNQSAAATKARVCAFRLDDGRTLVVLR